MKLANDDVTALISLSNGTGAEKPMQTVMLAINTKILWSTKTLASARRKTLSGELLSRESLISCQVLRLKL